MIHLSDKDLAKRLAAMTVYGGKYVLNSDMPCITVPEAIHSPITFDSGNLTFLYNSIKIKRNNSSYIGKQNIYAFNQGDIVFDAEKRIEGTVWMPWDVKQNKNIRDLLVVNGVSMIADPVMDRIHDFDAWLRGNVLPNIVRMK